MSKKESSLTTLRTIADQAKYNYQQHLNTVKKNERYIHAPLGAAALAEVEPLTEKGTPRMPGENFKERNIRISQGRVKGNLERAAEHYEQHQDEYFELGVKLADLEGIKIRVEQPFTVGEKVEVHVGADDAENIT